MTACNDKQSESIPTADLRITTFDSTVVYSPALNYIQHPSFCGYIPVPSDSTIQFSFDIDQNGSVDYQISMSNWYNVVSASNPCANYSSSIVISGIGSSYKIATIGNYTAIRNYALNEKIDGTAIWQNTANIKLQVPAAPFVVNLNGDILVGLLSIKQGNYNYGWLAIKNSSAGLSLVAAGYNATAQLAVAAGKF